MRSRLRARLTALLLLCGLGPLLVMSVVLDSHVSRTLGAVLISSNRDLTLRTMDAIAAKRRELERLANQVLTNPVLQAALHESREGGDYFAGYLRDKNIDLLLLSLGETSDVRGIVVTGTNGARFRSKNYLTLPADLERLQRALPGEGILSLPNDVFSSPDDVTYTDRYFYVVRGIPDIDHVTVTLGLLVLQVRHAVFAQMLRDSSGIEGEGAALFDARGVLLCSTAPADGLAELQAFSRGSPEEEGAVASAPGGGRNLLIRSVDRDSGWTLVRSIPARFLAGSLAPMRLAMGLFFVGFAAVFAFLAAAVSRSVAKPVHALREAMRRFSEGVRGPGIATRRRDELGDLERSFDSMAARITELMGARTRLELSVLEYQINPHFLYNTLDSINWMARKIGAVDIAEMVTALAAFFRTGLAGGREIVAVREEIEHARSYLAICAIRYHSCFTYALEVEPAAAELRTVKIVLQPLLENAMKHGIAKTRRDGEIRVRAGVEGQSLVFLVSDNGKGMEADRMRELQEALDAPGSSAEGGVGLRNVNERIRLRCGPPYGIRLRPREGSGLEVRVVLPLALPD